MKKLSKTKSAIARRKMRRTESPRARSLRLKIRRYGLALYKMRYDQINEVGLYNVYKRILGVAKRDYAKLSRKAKGLA